MRRADWCWERLRAGEEGHNRGWDGWMASPTQWTWVWVNSGSWWWTGRPRVLRFTGSQESDPTEGLNWTELMHEKVYISSSRERSTYWLGYTVFIVRKPGFHSPSVWPETATELRRGTFISQWPGQRQTLQPHSSPGIARAGMLP